VAAATEAAARPRTQEPQEAALTDTGNVARSEVRGPLAAPIVLPVSPLADTGNTGNGLDDQLAILANQEIGNERFDPSEWRIEVYTNRNGRRYWNHRRRGKRGGKENWKFGGRFDELSQERQEQYWQRTQGR